MKVFHYRRTIFIRSTNTKLVEDKSMTESEVRLAIGLATELSFYELLNNWNIVASRYTDDQNIYCYTVSKITEE